MAEQDPDRAADETEHDRFDQELLQDVARPRSHRHAQTDLAGALVIGYKDALLASFSEVFGEEILEVTCADEFVTYISAFLVMFAIPAETAELTA